MIGIMEMIKTTMEMRMISGKMLVTTTMTETIKMKMKTIKIKTMKTIKTRLVKVVGGKMVRTWDNPLNSWVRSLDDGKLYPVAK